jgi:predicted Zn-dependent protease
MIRVGIAALLAVFAGVRYCTSAQTNPVTGQVQRVAMTPEQEIGLGLQAAPKMAAEYGGEIASGPEVERVRRVGETIVESTPAGKGPYTFAFHLLADGRTVNAFALPGGQVFITKGLLTKLETEGQLGGVLGHEIGHVVARHGAQQLAKQQLTVGLASSANVATNGYGREIAGQIGALMNLKYGRNDELEADNYGVRYCALAGYDPRAMLGVMKVLASLDASGRQPEMLSTHPNPENRAQRIEAALKDEFPDGLPKNLKP